ncbi:MAG: flagellar FlbD family protein [Clostridiales bacterium]|jgi:flagellar protein FlbD|nr:flagellar FlbD family protein [Clostridiales bacterium]
MIKVTRLNGDPIYINSALIEFIEETPDTMVTLTTGKKLIIKEHVEDVIKSILEYNAKISQYIR